MTIRDFLNAANALSFVDKQDWMTGSQWIAFSADPVTFLRRADDDVAERIWALMRVGEKVE